MTDKWVVCGTGTEIGKTFVASMVLRFLVGRGLKTRGLKPVESGVTGGVAGDAAALAAAAGHDVAWPRYALVRAVSPHLAAREEGVAIELAEALRWCTAESEGSDCVVVETAGGLLSPLGEGVTNLDLVEGLEPDVVVVVAANRLGVLHDVSSVMLALETRGLGDEVVVVLNRPSADGDQSSSSNAGEIRRLGICDRVLEVAFGARGMDGSELAKLLGQP